MINGVCIKVIENTVQQIPGGAVDSPRPTLRTLVHKKLNIYNGFGQKTNSYVSLLISPTAVFTLVRQLK